MVSACCTAGAGVLAATNPTDLGCVAAGDLAESAVW